MKKLFFILSAVIASSMMLVSCDDDDDKTIQKGDLPATAQSFLDTYFADVTINQIYKDNDSYDVHLNGFEVEFTLSGDWDDIKSFSAAMPANILALIPASIPEYVATNYPNLYIVEINKEHYGYEIDLNNGLDLKFNSEGTFIGIDD